MTDLSTLNPQQHAAIIQSMDKNVVLLAGAGSGKTHTLIKRAEYLLDDMNVQPWQIMMVTFTNKAANEILERAKKVKEDAWKMWIGTFHRICTRIMRMYGKPLGVDNFTIMDTKNSKALVKQILENKGVETNSYLISDIVSEISGFKNNMRKPSEVMVDKTVQPLYASVYKEYQDTSWRMRTFDFDDLIIYTILLLSSFPAVKEIINNLLSPP